MQIAIRDETSEHLIHDVLQELQDPPERQGCAPKQTAGEQHMSSPIQYFKAGKCHDTSLFVSLVIFD